MCLNVIAHTFCHLVPLQSSHSIKVISIELNWEFPGSPVVKTLVLPMQGHGFNPWSGDKDPMCHTARPKNKELYYGSLF